MSKPQTWADLYHEEAQIKPGKGFILIPENIQEITTDDGRTIQKPAEWQLEPIELFEAPKSGLPCLIPAKVRFNNKQSTLGYALWDTSKQKICEIHIYKENKTICALEGSPEDLEEVGIFKDPENFEYELFFDESIESTTNLIQKYVSFSDIFSGIFDLRTCYKIDDNSILNSINLNTTELVLYEKMTPSSFQMCEDGKYLIRGLGYFQDQSILPVTLILDKRNKRITYNYLALIDEVGPVMFDNTEELENLGYQPSHLELAGFYSPLLDSREIRNMITSQIQMNNPSSHRNENIHDYFIKKKEIHTDNFAFSPSCLDFSKKIRVIYPSTIDSSTGETEEIIANINDRYLSTDDSMEIHDYSYCLVQLANNSITFGLVETISTKNNKVEVLSIFDGEGLIPLYGDFSLTNENRQLQNEEIFPITYKKIREANFKEFKFQLFFNEPETVTYEQFQILSAFMDEGN